MASKRTQWSVYNSLVSADPRLKIDSFLRHQQFCVILTWYLDCWMCEYSSNQVMKGFIFWINILIWFKADLYCIMLAVQCITWGNAAVTNLHLNLILTEISNIWHYEILFVHLTNLGIEWRALVRDGERPNCMFWTRTFSKIWFKVNLTKRKIIIYYYLPCKLLLSPEKKRF